MQVDKERTQSMLDLLLARAYEASRTLYARATRLPNPFELQRIRRSDEFVELMLEALAWIDAQDGRNALSVRKEDIVRFGELLSFVLFALQHRQLTKEEYFNLLAEEQEWN
jgi:hypothetical protein